MTPQQASLKNCPFCGGPVTLERTTSTFERSHGDRQWWGVVCRNTINLGGTCAIEQRPSASEDAAIERWNRRAPAPTSEPGARDRTLLKPMQNEDDEALGIVREWYFNCDGHYIDVALDDGKYSILFVDRARKGKAWLDQADDTATPASPTVPAAPLAPSKDEGAEPSWRTSDISWICYHLTEKTLFSGARLQREWNAMKAIALAADPAPLVAQASPEPAPITLMTERQAQGWAWNQVKIDCGLEKLSIGETIQYFPFFLHGWNYKTQYEKQQPTGAPEASPLVEDAQRIVAGKVE